MERPSREELISAVKEFEEMMMIDLKKKDRARYDSIMMVESVESKFKNKYEPLIIRSR